MATYEEVLETISRTTAGLEEMRKRQEKFAENIEADRLRREKSEKEQDEMRVFMKELGKQLGGLGNKFGKFTEGLAYRSLRKIMREHFHVEKIDHEVEVEKPDGREREYDMLGVSNGTRNEVIVAEVKSNLSRRDLDQTVASLNEFTEFNPEYRGWTIRGLLAVVYLPKGMEQQVWVPGSFPMGMANDHSRENAGR